MEVRSLVLPIIALSALAACSGGRDVHGSERLLKIDEQGFEYFEDLDLSGLDYQTFVDKGGGEYEVQGGQSYSVGVFIIQDVTEDEYLLLETNGEEARLFVSDSDDIDLSVVRLGRAYAERPTVVSELRVELGNLGGFGNDDFEFIAPNVGGLLHLEDSKTATPAADASEVTLTFDFNQLRIPFLNAELDDRFFVTKLEEMNPADSWRSISRVFEAPPISMANGASVRSSGAFVEVPQDQTLRADIRVAAFDALTEVVHPEATNVGGAIHIGSLYGAKKHGFHSAPATLLVYGTKPGTVDYTIDLTYGDPLPDLWDDIFSAEFTYIVEVQGEGATRSATIALSIGYTTTLDDAKNTPLEPRLTPVRNVTIQGNDARQNLTAVGSQPLIRWDAPATGNANAYRLTVFQFATNTDGSTVLGRFVEVYTEDTFFQFPTGALQPGPLFTLQITAYDEPSRDIDRVPFRHQLPAAHSDMLTGVFVP